MLAQNNSGSLSDSVSDLTKQVIQLAEQTLKIEEELKELRKVVIIHDTELNDRKVITNNYIDAIFSKIEILKNMIKKNIGDADQFISPHLLEVQSIEEQIKQTGKISDKQFKTLNEIYLKQKRIYN